MKRSTPFLILALLFNLNISAQCEWFSVGDTMNFEVSDILPDTAYSFIAGGKFTKIGSYDVAGIAQWDGTQWTHIAGSGIVGSEVAALCKYNGGYVAGGTFTMIDSVPVKNVAFYDGYNWSPIGVGVEYTGGITVSTLTIYDNDLIAGGTFQVADGNTVNNITRWNGSAWVALGNGINGTVNALCEYHGKLYAGGTFTMADSTTVHNIAVWDGTSWGDVGGGVNAYTGAITVSTLTVYNDELYVGGTFQTAGGDSIVNIARWNDYNWSDVGGGNAYTGAITVSTITTSEYSGLLVVSGKYLRTSDGATVYELLSWDGNEWTDLVAETAEPIETIGNIDGNMAVGGAFKGINDQTKLNYVAASACGTSGKFYQMLTGDTESSQEFFHTYPNPVVDALHLVLNADASDMREDAFRFTLTDITGRLIASELISGNDPKFMRNDIPSGFYYYDITNQNTGQVQKGKVVFK